MLRKQSTSSVLIITVSASLRWFITLRNIKHFILTLQQILNTLQATTQNASQPYWLALSTATLYSADGRGIESRWQQDIPDPSRPSLWPTQPPVQGAPPLLAARKAAGAWPWALTSPSSTEVKERAQLYVYSASEPSWPVLGWTSGIFF